MQTKKQEAQPKEQPPKQTRREREEEHAMLTKHLHPPKVERFRGMLL